MFTCRRLGDRVPRVVSYTVPSETRGPTRSDYFSGGKSTRTWSRSSRSRTFFPDLDGGSRVKPVTYLHRVHDPNPVRAPSRSHLDPHDHQTPQWTLTPRIRRTSPLDIVSRQVSLVSKFLGILCLGFHVSMSSSGERSTVGSVGSPVSSQVHVGFVHSLLRSCPVSLCAPYRGRLSLL